LAVYIHFARVIYISGNLNSKSSIIQKKTEPVVKTTDSSTENVGIIAQLLAAKTFSDEMVSNIIDCIRKIHSPKQQSDSLQLIAKHSNLSENQFRIAVNAIRDIEGLDADEHKAACLRVFCSREQFTVGNLPLVLSAAETIIPSPDRSNVYTLLIRNQYLKVNHYPSILMALGNLSNDSNKSELLCQIAFRLPTQDSAVCNSCIVAINSIRSSKEKTATILALISNCSSKEGM